MINLHGYNAAFGGQIKNLPSMLFGRFLLKEMIDINNPLTVIKSRKEITSNLVIITNQFSISYPLVVHLKKEMSDVLEQKMEQVLALAK